MDLEVVKEELTMLGGGSAQMKDGVLWMAVGEVLPAAACDFKRIKIMCLDHKVPDNLEVLKDVEFLDLSENNLSSVPENVNELNNLEELDVSHNQLRSLPESFGELKNLRDLNISYNSLTLVPECVSELNNLEKLDVSHNQLISLPDRINIVTSLPEGIDDLNVFDEDFEDKFRFIAPLTPYLKRAFGVKNLEELYLFSSLLPSLPESLINLKKLRELHLVGNGFVYLPPNVHKLMYLNKCQVFW